MNLFQSPYFRRSYKKLLRNQLPAVNEAIEQILSESQCGEERKGDLSGVKVFKFPVGNQMYLLAYECAEDNFYLHALGVHENFYRDLKRNR